eukprot:scaffold40431_cov77-Phaeocystis_antarctica.AAC.4
MKSPLPCVSSSTSSSRSAASNSLHLSASPSSKQSVKRPTSCWSSASPLGTLPATAYTLASSTHASAASACAEPNFRAASTTRSELASTSARRVTSGCAILALLSRSE